MLVSRVLVCLMLFSSIANAADLSTAKRKGKAAAAPPVVATHLDRARVEMTVVKLDAPAVLDLIAEQANVKIVVSKGFNGTVENLRMSGSASAALDDVANKIGAIWWWNGTEVYVANQSERTSQMMKVKDSKTLLAYARQAGLPVDMLSIEMMAGETAQVSGPSALVREFERFNEKVGPQIGVVAVTKYGKRIK